MLVMPKTHNAGIQWRKEGAVNGLFLLSCCCRSFRAARSPVIGGVWVDAVCGMGSRAWPVSSSAHY